MQGRMASRPIHIEKMIYSKSEMIVRLRSLPTHTQLARDATPNEDIAALSCRFLRQGVDGSRHARLAKMWSERDVHIIRGPIPYKDWPTLD